jgi:DNA/RNA-binding domain of Phe-tRNA-synthetase-like protein
MTDVMPQVGWVSDALKAEFPTLRLWWARHDATKAKSSPGLQERLEHLSRRLHGAAAVQLRTEPIPHAYRVFYRHVGIDPDEHRTPVEQAVVNRLLHGGYRSRGLIEDALLVAVAETGVPLWAIDEATLDGDLGIRAAEPGERLGRAELAHDVRSGRLVVADSGGPVAELFGEPPAPHAPSKATTTIRVYTVQVPNVPAIHVEEAFWLASEALESYP